ncbi:MAG: ATP-binding cassette domain-containing protein [Bacteroidota bacterium]|nr:ATP-binding cassette domain-containing protein [Bacteroidota bacterium]
MLQTKNLHINYSKKSISFPNIDLKTEDQLLITGRSGSGKTSFLNVLGGLQTPNLGSVKIDNVDLYALSQRELDHFRGTNIGFVFQRPHFISSLDVISNLKFSQYLVRKEDEKLIYSLLDKVGLLDRKKARIFELSEGEKQRISIVRSVVNSPKLILADEPTSALDDESCENILELIRSISLENRSKLIIVTHDHRLKNKFEDKLDLDALSV